ncbi:MAG: hypothetical protein LBC63_09310 [Holophagales bacterium]|jgi:hypothetical protein|nr:hypothetical protein [Holophagales bacterium]
MTTTALADTDSDLLSRLDGRLPSSPEEILEAIRLGEEDIKAGRCVPVEETIDKMRRAIAKHKKV